MNTISRNRGLRLVLGTLSLLFAGILYAWSILKSPLAAQFGWSASELALNFTLTMCFFAVGGLVSGLSIRKTGPKPIIIAGGLIAAAGFIITSYNKGNLPLLYLSYGVLAGAGIGLAYNGILASTNAWFPDKRGFSSGVLMMGFGASSLVIGGLAGKMIADPAIGWETTFRILGIAIGIFVSLNGIFAAFPAPAEKEQKPEKETGNEVSLPGNVKTADMVKSFNYWKLYLYFITFTSVGNVVISAAKDMALSTGATAALATSLVGVLSVCNGLGRLLCGALFDKKGRRFTITVGSIVTLCAPLVILLGILTQMPAFAVIGLVLSGISYGFSPTISSAIIGDFYGQKYFAMNFAITTTNLIPTSFVATFVGMIVSSTGSYTIPCILLAGIGVIALLLSFTVKKPEH